MYKQKTKSNRDIRHVSMIHTMTGSKKKRKYARTHVQKRKAKAKYKHLKFDFVMYSQNDIVDNDDMVVV